MTEQDAQNMRNEFSGWAAVLEEAYRQGYTDGQDDERAAVVAYLYDMGQDCRLIGRIREGAAVAYYANLIERGEHRRKEEE